MKDTGICSQNIYEIRPPFMFRWEASQQAYVLLYPEGIVKLNETGGQILNLCDGQRSVEKLIEHLAILYCASDLAAVRSGVMNFLEVSHGKGWIRIKA
ncbi:MAG: pyrroloquinoline quinone biosynthesis protein PqqD [Pseudomonadales bacterium 32-61-5]|nr:pyrroloquinoline quinone biosynthesis peptide chaperone PqqD [Stutzerimonas stutzeri]OYW95432.1 MAG: pyrroloquinoline quinone biosynthesis protein PqqD [Pseudomonadales bacterium 32-61-5]